MPHALPDHFGEKIALSIVSASIAETGLCAWVREMSVLAPQRAGNGLAQYINASLHAAAADQCAVTFPLDIVKTRMQIQGEHGRDGHVRRCAARRS